MRGEKGSESLGYLHELTQQENSRLKFKPSSDKEVNVYNHHTDANKLNIPPELQPQVNQLRICTLIPTELNPSWHLSPLPQAIDRIRCRKENKERAAKS